MNFGLQEAFNIAILLVTGMAGIIIAGLTRKLGTLHANDAITSKEIKETAALVLAEKEKLAALVMQEKEKLAALVMQEKEKLAALVKAEHDKLDEKFTSFRIKVAEDYATTTLLEKVLRPILDQLGKIEVLLESKLDRREFNEHRADVGKVRQ